LNKAKATPKATGTIIGNSEGDAGNLDLPSTVSSAEDCNDSGAIESMIQIDRTGGQLPILTASSSSSSSSSSGVLAEDSNSKKRLSDAAAAGGAGGGGGGISLLELERLNKKQQKRRKTLGGEGKDSTIVATAPGTPKGPPIGLLSMMNQLKSSNPNSAVKPPAGSSTPSLGKLQSMLSAHKKK
jgi:hypothetical protein